MWLCDVTATAKTLQLRDDLVTTMQRAVTTTVMSLRQNLSITLWRHYFVIFLFTDVDFIRYSSSITHEIDVIK